MRELKNVLVYDDRTGKGLDIDYIETDGKKEIVAVDLMSRGDMYGRR